MRLNSKYKHMTKTSLRAVIIGKGFIHVPHKKPLVITRGEYTLDPAKDLVPVCPNCHAMLHTCEPLLSIDELKMKIKGRRG